MFLMLLKYKHDDFNIFKMPGLMLLRHITYKAQFLLTIVITQYLYTYNYNNNGSTLYLARNIIKKINGLSYLNSDDD